MPASFTSPNLKRGTDEGNNCHVIASDVQTTPYTNTFALQCVRGNIAPHTPEPYIHIYNGAGRWYGAMVRWVFWSMCQPVKDIYPVEMVPVVLYPSLAGLHGYTCRHTHARARTHTAAYFLSAAPAS